MRILLLLKWILILSAVFILAACADGERKVDMHTIRVGVLPGRGGQEELVETIKKVAQKEGYDLNVQIVFYRTLAELNKALADRKIDINIFQPRPYFEYSRKKYGYRFSSIGTTFIYPMGIYSNKVNNVLEIKKGATIAIPEEPTNEARALFLLEKAGMIRIDSESMEAAVKDIVSNPSNFKFKTLPAGQLLDALPHVDAIVANGGFVLNAGLVPSQNALVIENQNSLYAQVITVREGEENEPRIRAFVGIFHSPEVEEAADKIFKGQAIKAW